MAHPIHEANEFSPYGNLTRQEFYLKHHILHQKGFMINRQKMKIYTQSWQPSDLSVKLKGLVGMIHGYSSKSSWLFELNAAVIVEKLEEKMAHPIHEANEFSPYGNLTRQEFYLKHHILHQKGFMINRQKMKIYTQSWQPSDLSVKLKGLVGMIHGYSSESSWLFELNAVAIAKSGFFVCALDLQGHGFSEGPRYHFTNFNDLVNDCLQYFDSARTSHPELPHFLYGESLGSSMALLVCLQQKTAWNGLIVSGVARGSWKKKFIPVWLLNKLIEAVVFFAPSWRVPFFRSPASISYKEDWKRKLEERSPNRHTCGKLTAAVGLQFQKFTEYIERNCHGLTVPILILHGGDDMVCEVTGAKRLYNSVASKDKTLKIYEGMWHQFIGEPNETVEEVVNTILSWIEVRAEVTSAE
ncbi:caffeoylshikimate esterase-like [Andrographis paniculata]|uniref:caffeoylshikimate esterase-like n=1 Tax=Andrographis paniculata TaxID=175694 RepID=UPI0021E8BDFC|nr:caffeoylshikimate esterase-like [Andrographis paniculata]